MVCFERIKKSDNEYNNMFERLQNYFKALEKNKIEEYHKQRGR